MIKTIEGHTQIMGGDLMRSAALIGARFRDRAAEAGRLAAARSFLNAAFRLERALKVQTRCALVNHCGTPGAHNLEEATRQLFQALSEYAEAMRELAAVRLESESTQWPVPDLGTDQAARLRAV